MAWARNIVRLPAALEQQAGKNVGTFARRLLPRSGAEPFKRKSVSDMEITVSSQLAVSLPVVVDVEGRQMRGVTQELGLDNISLFTESACSPGTAVTVVLCFSHNVAY